MNEPRPSGVNQVDPEELAQHAARVRRVAERVRVARDVAVEVGVGSWNPGMYGVLLGQLARMAAWNRTKTIDDLVGAVADLVEACAGGIEDERQSYEQLDRDTAELLGRVLRDGHHRRRDETFRVVDASLDGRDLEMPAIPPSNPTLYPDSAPEDGQ